MVEYEWDYEGVDAHGDVDDHYFQEKLADYPKPPHPKHERMVLLRHDDGGTMWAYVEHARLPRCFNGTDVAVPARFHLELSRWQRSLAKRRAA